AKFDSWNDERGQFILDPRRAGSIPLQSINNRPDALSILANRLLPTFRDLPHGAAPCLVVGLFAVTILRVINPLLASAGRSVVRIKFKHLIVTLHRQVVAAGLIKTFRFR